LIFISITVDTKNVCDFKMSTTKIVV